MLNISEIRKFELIERNGAALSADVVVNLLVGETAGELAIVRLGHLIPLFRSLPNPSS